MGDQIIPFDFVRMLLGDAPGTFTFEVILRITVLYIVLVAATRVMGRRLASGLTRNELLALASLAAAIGPAVQDPDRGLLPPMIIAAMVALFQRGVALATTHSRRVETLLQGSVATLVTEGRIDLKVAKRNGISRERILARVRGLGVLHLGHVERLYLESDGNFSAVMHDGGRPGLSVIPEWDAAMRSEQKQGTESSCAQCGALVGANSGACRFCRSERSAPAVVD
jgi:uncharacterized membrane protein YcaP (DUF421 family)